jgi:glycosyltransferase involved in cell wall biosynthesis
VGGNDPEDLRRLQALSGALGLESRVHFVGQVPPHAVGDYWSRARVGVVPLPGAGFVEAARFTSPLKIFEAMQAGTPLVATDLPSVRELIHDREHALLAAPDDPAALARSIETLLVDRRLAARLVSAAGHRVLEFSWEARARRVLEFAAGLPATAQALGA